MVEAYDKVVQVRVRVPSWFTFREKVQPMTLIANTYNLTHQKLYLLYQLFFRGIFHYIFVLFVLSQYLYIFAILVVLLWYLLLYLLYQLFCRDIFYYVCCVNQFAVAPFPIFVMSIVLSYQLFLPLHFLLLQLAHLTCFVSCIHGVLGLCTNWLVAWSY